MLTDGSNNPITFPDDEQQAAVSVIDTKSGAIHAIGGRRNNDGNFNYNLAIDLDRQGGSVIKPILSYGPAIEFENYSTYEQILDKEFAPKGSQPIRNVDRVKNRGLVSMREALTHSYNVPAAKTFLEVGSEQAKPFAEKLGLTFKDKVLDPRDAIGGTSSGISPLELAGAYSAFGNEGIYNEPYSIVKIEFPDGSVISHKSAPVVAMSDYTAYMVTDMLKSVMTDGTGRSAHIPGLAVAGKTGTTNMEGGGANNVWFGGYTTNFTVTSWSGYADTNNRKLADTSIARQLFKHIMTEISKDVETADFVKPKSVVELAIEKHSNPAVLASENTPKNNIVKELFIKGTEPSTVSKKFEELAAPTKLKASFLKDLQAIEIDWEYANQADSIEFDVSYSVNDGELKSLPRTKDLSLKLTDVDVNATYTIQVIAVDTKTSEKSEAISVSVSTLDDEEPDPPNKEIDIPEITNLAAQYDEENTFIDVTWDYSGPKGVQFEVNINGQVQIVKTHGVKANNPEPGQLYTISVTVISVENAENKSKQTSTSITIPEPDDDGVSDSDDDLTGDGNRDEDEDEDETDDNEEEEE